ncbi:MAG: hypothetical protein ACLP8B_09475 [Xanthobacteraceae bacterium]
MIVPVMPSDRGNGLAMRTGFPIVATRFATEGTTFQHGVDMLMADNEANFLCACRPLARDRSFSARLVARARTRAMRSYSPASWRTRVAASVANSGDPRQGRASGEKPD